MMKQRTYEWYGRFSRIPPNGDCAYDVNVGSIRSPLNRSIYMSSSSINDRS